MIGNNIKFILLNLFLVIMATIPVAAGEIIFSEDFSSSDFSAGNWIVDGGWEIKSNGRSGRSDKRAEIKGDVVNASLTKAIPTADYQNIQLEFFYRAAAYEKDNHVVVEWFDGENWQNLIDITDANEDDTKGDWVQKVFNLPDQANNNENFQFRFRATLDAASDTFKLDDVLLSGELVEKEIQPITIKGFKWSDLNGDGIWQKEGEVVEPGIEGWQISLVEIGQSQEENTQEENTIIALTLTGSDGMFSFTVTPAQSTSYRIFEEKREGWQQTFPADSFFDIFIDLTAEEVTADRNNNPLNFGNQLLSVEPTPPPILPLPDVPIIGGSGSGAGSGGGSSNFVAPEVASIPVPIVLPPLSLAPPPASIVSEPIPVQLVINRVELPEVIESNELQSERGLLASLIYQLLKIFNR